MRAHTRRRKGLLGLSRVKAVLVALGTLFSLWLLLLPSSPSVSPVPWEAPSAYAWVGELEGKARSVISQGCQDGVLLHLFESLGWGARSCVEFGYYKSSFAPGANSEMLRRDEDFKCLLMDGGNEDASINLHREFIKPDNVVALFEKHGVKKDVDYVSIDIDSRDGWVFRALVLESKAFRPRVISVEYNCHWDIDTAWTIGQVTPVEPFMWQFGDVYGASLKTLHMIGDEAGYYMVYVDECLDAFFVRKDLMPDFEPIPLRHWEHKTNKRIHPNLGRAQFTDYVWDYEVWRKDKSADAARSAANEAADDFYARSSSIPIARMCAWRPYSRLVELVLQKFIQSLKGFLAMTGLIKIFA